MDEHKLISKPSRSTLYWSLIAAGVALILWQFFTFVNLLEGHTAQARKLSRSASWAGQPVGTMPQPSEMSAGLMNVQHSQLGAGAVNAMDR